MEALEKLLPWAQLLSTVGALIVAFRALGHTQHQDSEHTQVRIAVEDAKTGAIITEFGAKFERAFASMEKLADRLQEHELECAREKSTLTEKQRAMNDSFSEVMGRLENLSRQLGYLSRDLAQDDLRRQGIPTGDHHHG